jgi:transcription elongation factor Elf1
MRYTLDPEIIFTCMPCTKDKVATLSQMCTVGNPVCEHCDTTMKVKHPKITLVEALGHLCQVTPDGGAVDAIRS